MKTKNLYVAVFFVICILMMFWDLRFGFPVFLIFIFWLIGEYNARPGKKSVKKSRQVLDDFLDNVEDLNNPYMVRKELERYTVRKLCYLYDGLNREIYHMQGSDFLTSLSEEELQDQMRQKYEKVRDMVYDRIPTKYQKDED